jgi:hypothetical protein
VTALLTKEIEDAIVDLAADSPTEKVTRLTAVILAALRAAEQRGARDALLAAARDVEGSWINSLAFMAWLERRAAPAPGQEG